MPMCHEVPGAYEGQKEGARSPRSGVTVMSHSVGAGN